VHGVVDQSLADPRGRNDADNSTIQDALVADLVFDIGVCAAVDKRSY